MRRTGALLSCLLLCLPALAGAERVAPSERVRSNVVIRSQPRAGSPRLGRLEKGQALRLLAHKVIGIFIQTIFVFT